MGLQVKPCFRPRQRARNEGVENVMHAIIETGGKQYKGG